jgi:hypothetical protein
MRRERLAPGVPRAFNASVDGRDGTGLEFTVEFELPIMALLSSNSGTRARHNCPETSAIHRCNRYAQPCGRPFPPTAVRDAGGLPAYSQTLLYLPRSRARMRSVVGAAPVATFLEQASRGEWSLNNRDTLQLITAPRLARILSATGGGRIGQAPILSLVGSMAGSSACGCRRASRSVCPAVR